MVLRYRFHKERLKDGAFAYRPLILIDVSSGSNHLPFQIAALLDSGCDVTIIPEEFARILKLKQSGETVLMAYKEKTNVRISKMDITFLGKVQRENITLHNVPVFIAPEDDEKFLPEVVIGIKGIYDKFDITFSLGRNRIELKKTDALRRKLYY